MLILNTASTFDEFTKKKLLKHKKLYALIISLFPLKRETYKSERHKTVS